MLGRLLRRLGAAWRRQPAGWRAKASAGQPAPLLACPLAPDWTPENQADWVTFLRTPTGQRLRYRMRAIHSQMAIKASEDVFHPAHSAGAAKGFGEALAWLESLSRSARVDADPALDGATDSPPGGDQALAERLSP